MAKHALLPKARLRLQLDNEVLLGVAGGQHVHCLVRIPSDPSGEDTIEHGIYEILPPVADPLRGRIAICTHLEEESIPSLLGGRSSVGSAIVGAVGHRVHPAHAAVQHVLADGTAPAPTLILAGGPLGGSNVVVVITGFDELMDLLEESGGGSLEVEA
jgi:hypothetical protein